ncbi:hypothetical protein NM219_03780 [Parvimonas micra]|uniref:hypothetical protein n=1 Tax=Parvimonas micra TaxID=33033 RepID=UPI0022B68C9F|nr:hypothetical protein [Parvimonas micra]WBB34645.1 hypothetical protein NM220_03780 [Parvimonas micra]WBB36166.1 hypothetical protein NM219_03780 [Parvimonas micra]
MKKYYHDYRISEIKDISIQNNQVIICRRYYRRKFKFFKSRVVCSNVYITIVVNFIIDVIV